MNKLYLAVAMTLAASAALGSAAGGREDETRTAAINLLEVEARNVTPPDRVGYRIDINVSGDVTATSPRKVAKRCRVSREVFAVNTTVGGDKRKNEVFHPTSRRGHFESNVDVEYAFTNEEGEFIDGDVPESGGRITYTVKVKPTTVPKDRLGFESFKCRKLKATAVVDVAPAAPDE